MSDARVMRCRQEDTASAARRTASAGHHSSEAMLVQTHVRGTYPAVASAFYACSPLRIDGSETEGASASFTADPSRSFLALNLGSKVPPVGTKLIVHAGGGRWTFRYDG